jgi:hypothetical protein
MMFGKFGWPTLHVAFVCSCGCEKVINFDLLCLHMFSDGKVWAHFYVHNWKQIRWKVLMLNFLCLVMGVFRTSLITKF